MRCMRRLKALSKPNKIEKIVEPIPTVDFLQMHPEYDELLLKLDFLLVRAKKG